MKNEQKSKEKAIESGEVEIMLKELSPIEYCSYD